jgi:hypothetical protein
VNPVGGGERDRVDDHAALGALDTVDFGGLLLDGEVLVDDSQTAELRHGDGEARFGHSVHGGAEDRNVEADVASQSSGHVHLAGHEGDVLRHQQHIVERQGRRDSRGSIGH